MKWSKQDEDGKKIELRTCENFQLSYLPNVNIYFVLQVPPLESRQEGLVRYTAYEGGGGITIWERSRKKRRFLSFFAENKNTKKWTNRHAFGVQRIIWQALFRRCLTSKWNFYYYVTLNYKNWEFLQFEKWGELK